MEQVIEIIEQECSKYNAEVVIVSKIRSLEQMEFYYNRGYRNFGENKVQEILLKKEWHEDVNWHFIGRLQTNKVRDVVRYCSLLHSLNRYELMDAIEKEAAKQNKVMDCLLQFNIAEEETKSGFAVSEVNEIIEKLKEYPHVHVKGIMCMGPHVNDEELIRRVFKIGKTLFEELKRFQNSQFEMKYLSMGMSQDYAIALQEGSNMLRIGRILFEEGYYV